MNLLIIGVQGSGKGTQGKLLAKKLNIPHISTGDLCRGTDEKTKLGKKVREYMDKGELVPIELMTELLKKRLEEDDTKKGIVLEGYPRFIDQAKLLEGFLTLDYVLFIKISDKEALMRISGRKVCKKCGAIYNIYTSPKPKDPDICDKCKSKLYQRKDENVEAVKKRISIFHSETLPLIEYYRNKGILIEVNGEKPIEKVHEEILKKVKIR